ncbi:ribonuclease HII [Pelistega indica]|uniref:Ribonuclease HII n=1 Tax=Pelistega indica TaxID=1414851 RepID=V8G7K8_9BURK|nr:MULTISPECIES: ribonuclease HII [Pelistega]ETD72504.1 ribonuclease HII [Pelistega indica]
MENLSLFDVENYQLIAGVDEAGRGPLAGDVFAAAVILDGNYSIEGLTDSKKLSEAKRDKLAIEIKQKALAWCIASASVTEIDTLNILQATMLAMIRAVKGLSIKPELVLIDGNRVPKELRIPARAIVKGDLKEQCISAASILAKTARDASLVELHQQFPQYAFNQHKGYGTAQHLSLLKQYGPCIAHRRSFSPVKEMLVFKHLAD